MTILCDRVERVSHCLYETSVLDDQTGLCNRRSFLGILDKETHRALRYRTDLSICLIRIEDDDAAPTFSCFNVNSPVLKAMTDAISDQMRLSDTFGRLDSRTFALIMPHTPEPLAVKIKERIEKLVETHRFFPTGSHPNITFGLATLRKDGSESSEKLYARAQMQLK
jgi:diguanylate cyclase (GGDEF)-like protein